MSRKTLFKNTPVVFTIGAILGGILGLGMMLSSLQLYQDAKSLLYSEDGLMSSGYMVINKPVTLLRTFAGKAASFDQGEIDALAKQKKVEQVAAFASSAFPVTAYLQANKNTPPFYTHLFFESLPDDFVDFDRENWHWKEGDKVLPVVIPRQYLTLYNFGFATSQNLPQISEGVIRNVSFNVTVGDEVRGRQQFEGRIVSFSDRINSILVPLSFMQWANDNYADEDQGIARVALKVSDENDPELHDFLKTEGYEIAGEEGSGSTLKQFVDYTFITILVVSVIILALTVLVLLISFQVLVFRNKIAIEYMLDLGYSVRYILLSYTKRLVTLSIIILIGAWAIFIPAHHMMSDFLASKGMFTSGMSGVYLTVGSLSLLLVLFAANWLSLNRQLTRIFWGK